MLRLLALRRRAAATRLAQTPRQVAERRWQEERLQAWRLAALLWLAMPARHRASLLRLPAWRALAALHGGGFELLERRRLGGTLTWRWR